MSVGLVAKALNAIHFKNPIDFFLEFLPEFIFLLAMFGYMDTLIVVKWLINWGLYNPNAPSIITTMINLPLKLGKTVKNWLNLVWLLWRTTDVGWIFKYITEHLTILAFTYCCYLHSMDFASKTYANCLQYQTEAKTKRLVVDKTYNKQIKRLIVVENRWSWIKEYWTQWTYSSSTYRNNWIHLRMHFEYCFLSKAMGSFSCSFSTFISIFLINSPKSNCSWLPKNSTRNLFVN